MIATVLLGVCLAAAGPDGPPKPEDLGTSSRGEALAGSGAEAPGRHRASERGGREDRRAARASRPRFEGRARGRRRAWPTRPGPLPRRVGGAGRGRRAGPGRTPMRPPPWTSTTPGATGRPTRPALSWYLADWCEHRGLKAEAIAHLTVLTQLDPNYSPAWHRLGYRSIHGRWCPRRSTQSKAAAEDQKKADHYWDHHLVAIPGGSAGPSRTRAAGASWRAWPTPGPSRRSGRPSSRGSPRVRPRHPPARPDQLARVVPEPRRADPRRFALWESEVGGGRGFLWVGRI